MTPQRTRHPNKSYKTNRGTQYTSTPPHQRTQHTLPAIHITGQTIFSTNFAILHSDEPHLHQLNSEEHPTWNQDRFVYTNTENTVETPDSACIAAEKFTEIRSRGAKKQNLEEAEKHKTA